MTVVTITLDDTAGDVAVKVDIPGGYDRASPACNMANAIMNHLDAIAERKETADVTPRVVLAAEEINQRRADMVRHIAPEPIIIYAG